MKYLSSLIKLTIIATTVGSLSACVGYFSDRAHSERLFEQYCHEEGRVGQFIYERAALGQEYFRPIPPDAKELRYVNEEFYIENKKLLIDQQYFKQSYTVNYQKKTMLSSIGPIYSVETTIVRKADSKVLSKAVSLLNMLDKTSKYFPVEGVTCLTKNIKGSYVTAPSEHSSLIKNTFVSNN